MELIQLRGKETKANLFDSDCPTAAAKPQKRWSLACKAVYFIVTLSLKALPKNTRLITTFIRSPSYVALDVDPNPDEENDDQELSFTSFVFDPKKLSKMMREKNLEYLSQVGGVRHLALTLGTNQTLGVSSKTTADITYRKNIFGSNIYQKPPKKSFFSFVLEAFKDTTIIILLFCAVFSLGFGIKQHGLKQGWYDGGSIIIAIFLVVFVSAISNFKQSRQFERLSEESSNIQIEALRDGCRQKISIFEVVVGDIVFLKIGDQILADGLFLDGHSLKLDESSLTGESDHVNINDKDNPFLFSGTKVTDGYGRMLITSVGMNTTWGEMMSSISRDLDEQTPLQVRLNKLTSYIGKVGLLVASLVLLVLLVQYFTGHTL